VNRYRGTQITAPPAFEGLAGKAWRIELPPPGQRERPDYDGTVGIYLVHARDAHPVWDHWMVSVIHLRPIPGCKAPTVRLAGATHEFVIAALDPGSPLPALVADVDWAPRLLRPIDVVEQFIAASDVVADQILELSVRAIVDGRGSPDQDWRPWWTDSIALTARHFADGTHVMGNPS
jgi:hypothetical protein